MEVLGVTAIILRQLIRWYSHPSIREAHMALDVAGVRAFLVQLEHLLYEMEAMIPGLTEQVIMLAAAGALTERQVVDVLREAGVTETQIRLALGRS